MTAYSEWLSDLISYAHFYGYEGLIFEDGDYEEYYDDGMTIEEVLDHEIDSARACM